MDDYYYKYLKYKNKYLELKKLQGGILSEDVKKLKTEIDDYEIGKDNNNKDIIKKAMKTFLTSFNQNPKQDTDEYQKFRYMIYLLVKNNLTIEINNEITTTFDNYIKIKNIIGNYYIYFYIDIFINLKETNIKKLFTLDAYTIKKIFELHDIKNTSDRIATNDAQIINKFLDLELSTKNINKLFSLFKDSEQIIDAYNRGMEIKKRREHFENINKLLNKDISTLANDISTYLSNEHINDDSIYSFIKRLLL